MKKLIILTAIVSLVPFITFASAGTDYYYGLGYTPYSQSQNPGVAVGYSVAPTNSYCVSGITSLGCLIQNAIGYLQQALALLVAVSVVVFVYYIFKYFIKPNENHEEANKYVMYSLIGFFVMISLWGLVNILTGTFKFNTTAPTNIQSLFPQ